MNELLKKLPEEKFFQTHRSFYIQLEKISSIDLEESVAIINEKQIPLSKRNRDALIKKLDWI